MDAVFYNFVKNARCHICENKLRFTPTESCYHGFGDYFCSTHCKFSTSVYPDNNDWGYNTRLSYARLNISGADFLVIGSHPITPIYSIFLYRKFYSDDAEIIYDIPNLTEQSATSFIFTVGDKVDVNPMVDKVRKYSTLL